MKPFSTTRTALVVAAVYAVFLPATALHAAAPPDSLVKASAAAVYYYAADGKRYVFPTKGVYDTWFSGFDGINLISDAELAAMPLGGNVTCRPGIRMVKIKTDPRVYAVGLGGLLHWVPSEATAAALYGPEWSRFVSDVPDSLFTDYRIGDPITDATGWTAESAAALSTTINADKGIAVGLSPRHSNTAPPAVSSGITTTGAAYYVSPSGNDDGPGTLANPWRTIQFAADRLVAGDTLYVRNGTYHERVRPQNSGQAGKWITYAAYPGETPVLDGNGVTMPADQAGLFEITDRNFIKLSGLKVMNVRGDLNSNGILVDRSGDVVIEKCVTYDTQSSGIGVWSSRNIVIEGNDIELAGHGGNQESLSIAVTDNFDVRDNVLRGGGDKEGICLKDGSSNGRVYRNRVSGVPAVGIYVDAWDKSTHDIRIYQNVVHDVTASDGISVASEMGGQLDNVYIYDNVVYGNRYVGLKVTRNGESATHPMRNVQIINNTAYGNGQDWGGCVAVDDPGASGVIVRNNICSQNRSFEISVSGDVPAGNVTVDTNLVFSYKGDTEDGEIAGVGSITSDPLFVDAAKHDFHLLPGSPAIDKGSASGAPTVDFDGRARPRGTAIDLGAFEY